MVPCHSDQSHAPLPPLDGRYQPRFEFGLTQVMRGSAVAGVGPERRQAQMTPTTEGMTRLMIRHARRRVIFADRVDQGVSRDTCSHADKASNDEDHSRTPFH